MAIPYQTIRNYDVYRGDDFIKKFTLVNNSDPAFDYTGSSVLMQVKASTEDAAAVLQATPTPITSTPGEMEIDIFIPGAETATVPPGEYFFDIQYTLSDGRIRTYVQGKMIIKADTSR